MAERPTEDAPVDEREAAGFTRLLRVLRRQADRPEVMAGLFAGVGARGVVTALATIAFGPRREDVTYWDDLPELLRRGLHAAAAWPGFDAEDFGADLAELLQEGDEQDQATVSAVTSYLLTSGQYSERLLTGWSRAFDALALTPDPARTWGAFLTGADAPQPWSGLSALARQRCA